MHVLFQRQHNRLALGLKNLMFQQPAPDTLPLATVLDEALYLTARRILVGQWQRIIYTQWLPLVLGEETMKNYGKSGR